MLKEQIQQAVAEAIREHYGDTALPVFSVEAPETEEHGDYACNAAMVMAKMLNKDPREIARVLVVEIEKKMQDVIKQIVVAPPGFINMTVRDRALFAAADHALKNPWMWGRGREGEGKTIVLDYFQLNIAKQPHVGHLRSAVIGDALKRILSARGYRTISDTHVGDWGTQFGILLYAYKQAIAQDSHLKDSIQTDPFAKLQELYTAAGGDENAHENGKKEFAKLERGDQENRQIWEWMVDISMKKLEDNAARLKLLAFDEHRGESAYEGAMLPIAEDALKKGAAKKTEDGAVMVDLTHEGLDEVILVKSDGATTYLLRDLATLKYRKEKWHFWKNLYVVDNRQSHHFQQVFRVAELLGWEGAGDSAHVEFGFMKLPEGVMSTRKGNVISLEALLDEAERRSRAIIQEKNPDLAEADLVAKEVALGAIKFFDLSHHRKSDIIFRWEEALSFEGSTGPYIQYAHARLKSILGKAEKIGNHFSDDALLSREEHALLLSCVRLPEIILRVIDTWSPHLLAAYLYELARKTNAFYHAYPILSEIDKKKKDSLLMLVQVVATTLATGLYLLGIDALEEM